MRVHENRVLYGAVVAALAASSAPALHAQTEPSATGLEEIVVTARKRDEALIDVPVAVSAFSAQEIESAGIVRPQDFIALTPNMTMVQTQNQGTSFIVVRGISQARNSEPSVAVLIDGVAMANPSQFNQELFDIQSIEVLKGPQGALYGRNAIGGAIIINTVEPSKTSIDGKLTLGYDSGPGYKVRAGVGGPVGDSEELRFQLSGSYLDTDGYTNNTYLHEEADPFKDLSVRGRLIWEPSETFRADVRASVSNVDTQALYFNITESANDTSLDVRVNNRGVNWRDMQSFSVKLDLETAVGTLTSVTGYDTLEEMLTGDQFDFLPIAESVWSLFNIPTGDQAQHQFLDVDALSQEIRITSPAEGRVQWIAGAYVIATDRFISTGNVRDIGDGRVPEVKKTPLDPWLGPGSDARQLTYLADEQDNLAWAVFADVTFELTDQFEADVALRYDRDERENTTRTPQAFIPLPLVGIAFPGQVREETWDEWQPKLTLRYKPNDDVMLYAGWSRGFRSGGFNQTGVGATGIAGIGDIFDKETADTLEGGVKARLWDGRLSTSLAAYQTKAEGSYFFVFDPATSTQNLGNLDEVDYVGFEAEAQSAVTDWLELYARAGYTDSEIKESDRDPDDVGNQAPLVSEYTINLGAQITGSLPFGNDLTFFIRPDFQIIGDTYWYPDNFTVRDPVNLLNLRAGIGAEAWTVTAWSRNLTDEEYNAEWSPGPQGFPSPGYTNNFVFKAQPFVWGLDFTYRF